ncbi:hypothetical protein SOVF_056300 [Spinacia oleracea]|uniref:Uncharacterized protein n=1 Tax=Spinacia oleracea TaxID=3562 RepID=A0A9R0JWH8_SPIOL|nr:uncharacterized protein LOC110788788 [Spinacia oleracea]KNA20019.1 hypothetical protein SOVF_056300 [Spinacia oleracea]
MMVGGVSSSVTQQSTSCSPLNSLFQNRTICSNSQFPSLLIANYRHNHLPTFPQLSFSSRSQSPKPIYCSNSPGAGENDSKTVLDAFFLGKALGEALTERIESTVGEFLSTVGRLQAEQQKQVQEFQEDVLERAKRAKEKAARESMEEQGRLIPNSSTRNAAERNGASSSAMVGPVNPAAPIRRVVNPDGPAYGGLEDRDTDSDSLSSITIDE